MTVMVVMEVMEKGATNMYDNDKQCVGNQDCGTSGLNDASMFLTCLLWHTLAFPCLP